MQSGHYQPVNRDAVQLSTASDPENLNQNRRVHLQAAMSVLLSLFVIVQACYSHDHAHYRHGFFVSSHQEPQFNGWYFLQKQASSQALQMMNRSLVEAPDAIFEHTTKDYYLAVFEGSKPQDGDRIVYFPRGMACLRKVRPTSTEPFAEHHPAEIKEPSPLQIVEELADHEVDGETTPTDVFLERYVCAHSSSSLCAHTHSIQFAVAFGYQCPHGENGHLFSFDGRGVSCDVVNTLKQQVELTWPESAQAELHNTEWVSYASYDKKAYLIFGYRNDTGQVNLQSFRAHVFNLQETGWTGSPPLNGSMKLDESMSNATMRWCNPDGSRLCTMELVFDSMHMQAARNLQHKRLEDKQRDPVLIRGHDMIGYNPVNHLLDVLSRQLKGSNAKLKESFIQCGRKEAENAALRLELTENEKLSEAELQSLNNVVLQQRAQLNQSQLNQSLGTRQSGLGLRAAEMAKDGTEKGNAVLLYGAPAAIIALLAVIVAMACFIKMRAGAVKETLSETAGKDLEDPATIQNPHDSMIRTGEKEDWRKELDRRALSAEQQESNDDASDDDDIMSEMCVRPDDLHRTRGHGNDKREMNDSSSD